MDERHGNLERPTFRIEHAVGTHAETAVEASLQQSHGCIVSTSAPKCFNLLDLQMIRLV